MTGQGIIKLLEAFKSEGEVTVAPAHDGPRGAAAGQPRRGQNAPVTPGRAVIQGFRDELPRR